MKASLPAALLNSLLWAITSVFSGLVRTLFAPAMRLLRTSLVQPYPLGPGALQVWSFMRDATLAGLTLLILYGALRHMLAPALGLGAASPATLISRLVAATAGTALSMTVISWLLQANATFVRAILAEAGTGRALGGLLEPAASLGGAAALAGGTGVLAADVFGLACLAAALWVAAAYYLRAAEILLLTALAPVAAALWALPETAHVWQALFTETVVAVFTQAGQALVLWLAASAGFLGGGGAIGNLLTSLALLVLLARVRPLLQALMHGGRPQGGWGAIASWQAARRVSLGATAAVGRLVRGAIP